MNKYEYKPVRFFIVTYAVTWILWIVAALESKRHPDEAGYIVYMLLGLLIPAIVAVVMTMTSKSPALKKDYKEKLIDLKKLNGKNLLLSSALFGLVILVSILISLLFGESKEQFAFTEDFSFSIGSIPTLFTLVLTAVIEELGWRGYAEDSIAVKRNWFRVSIIFGVLWSAWHWPLFLIQGTYQSNILEMSPWYMVNFFLSAIPLGFVLTWVYVENKRSIFSCVIFHFIVNFLQEEIAMTQVTKCIETLVLSVAAVIIVIKYKEMFFETNHVGNILNE